MSKKYVAILLVILMVMSMNGRITVSSAEGIMRFDENFDSYQALSELNGQGGWTALCSGTGMDPAKVNVTVNAEPNNVSNNIGRVYDSVLSGASATATLDFTKISGANSNGTVTVQYSYMQGAMSKNGRIFLMDGNNPLCSVYVNASVNCGLSMSAPTTSSGGTNVNTTLGWGTANDDGTYLKKNTWFTLKFVLNFTDQTIKCYYNGSTTAKSAYFVTAGCTGIDRIKATTANDSITDYSLDNITIIEGTDILPTGTPTPAATSSPMSTSTPTSTPTVTPTSTPSSSPTPDPPSTPMPVPTLIPGRSAYYENFTNANVIGVSDTPWTYKSASGYCNMTINSDGELTRDVASYDDYRQNSVVFNNLITDGAYYNSFDLSIKYGSSTKDSSTELVYYFNNSSNGYYALVFRLSAHTAKGYPARSVNLIKVNSQTSTTKRLASCPYNYMPLTSNSAREYHIELMYSADGKITVDCTYKNNQAKTRLFDNVEDLDSDRSKFSKGKFGLTNCQHLQFTLDNFFVNNNGYVVKAVTYYDEGNNLVSVNAEASVASDFASGILVVGIYDDNGKLLAVKTKQYVSSDVADGNIKFQDMVEKKIGNIAKVKTFWWNSLQDAEPYSSGENGKIDPLGDIDNPPYVPANVPHANVVAEAIPSNIPTDLQDLVVKTYPNGKLKAAVLSFDDGWAQDFDIVLPILRQYGLKSAFNLCVFPSSSNVFLGHDQDGKVIWAGANTTESYKRLVNEKYDGFEIANHGSKHWSDYNINKDHVRAEIGDNKTRLELMFNKEVAGYVRAGGSNSADAEPASGEWRRAYEKYIGIRYVRHAPFAYPGTNSSPSSFTFPVPDDFFDWSPTIKITEDPIANLTRVDLLNEYINRDPENQMKLFFGWGHPWEMGSESYPTYALNLNSNYEPFVQFCQNLSNHLDTIWNPTPLEYVDYVNATRNIQMEKNTNGNITIYNPSTDITVWLKIRGIDTAVAPGETVEGAFGASAKNGTSYVFH